MARDWLPTWRRARFGGAHFWTDSYKLETGRALVVHEFPHRDTPYVEDLGRTANKGQITAYVASDDAVGEASALFAACGRRGAQTLELPMERLKAHCDKCERDWSRDKQGFIAFSLSFVRDGGGAAPFSAPYLGRMVDAAAAALVAPAAALLAERFDVSGRSGLVLDRAGEDVQDVAAALGAVRAALPLDPVRGPAAGRLVDDVYDLAGVLAPSRPSADTWTGQSFIAGRAPRSSPPDIAGAVAGALRALREASPADAFAAAVAGVIEYTVGAPAAPPRSPSRRRALANGAALAGAVRMIGLAEWAAAIAEIEIADRRTAIAWRAEVAERFDAEATLIGGPGSHAAMTALAAVRDATVQYLSRAIADLKPIVRASSGLRMPSLWWSYLLYADAARAGELAARNRAIHSSFLPRDIEALAP